MTITNIRYDDLNEGTLIVEFDDGTVKSAGLEIPSDPRSIGNGPIREAVDDWLAEGNTPLPADPPPVPAPAPITAEEVFDILERKGLAELADRPRPRPT